MMAMRDPGIVVGPHPLALDLDNQALANGGAGRVG